MKIRIGHGYDVHAFGDGDHIVLGGVRIPYERGLIAHSDGDVIIHALCDALLGACALGDIGKHFPDTDAAFSNVDSRELLRDAVKKIHGLGYRCWRRRRSWHHILQACAKGWQRISRSVLAMST